MIIIPLNEQVWLEDEAVRYKAILARAEQWSNTLCKALECDERHIPDRTDRTLRPDMFHSPFKLTPTSLKIMAKQMVAAIMI